MITISKKFFVISCLVFLIIGAAAVIFYNHINPSLVMVAVTIDQEAENPDKILASVIAEIYKDDNTSMIDKKRQPHTIVFAGDNNAPLHYSIILKRSSEKHLQHNNPYLEANGKLYQRYIKKKTSYHE